MYVLTEQKLLKIAMLRSVWSVDRCSLIAVRVVEILSVVANCFQKKSSNKQNSRLWTNEAV